ncbi:MAG: hypothetical protein QOJ63_1605 [Solirubrobacteraceae bacterium]|nr:hypothetical protein [Solirubrobacteraceae bacterium]
MPSRKWFATQVTAIAALPTMWITTQSWDVEESVALIDLVSQAAVGTWCRIKRRRRRAIVARTWQRC